MRHITFTSKVFHDIMRALGSQEPEQGGVLGSSDGGSTINHFYYDKTASVSSSTYTPDVSRINKLLKSWNINGIRMVGIVHSHPTGYFTPSNGDQIYAARILASLCEDYFLLSIMQRLQSGEYDMHGFCAYNSASPYRRLRRNELPVICPCNIVIKHH